MKIAVATDHAGFALKQHVVAYLRQQGHEVLDLGVETDAVSVDYPDAARAVGEALQQGQAERAVLLCGSGVGASIAANKMDGIYAAICHDAYSAAQGVQHDNMNVLVLGGRVVGPAVAETLLDAFTGATFEAHQERFVRRFNKVRALESSGS